MITANEVKVLDINAEYYGTPPDKLMENAGRHVAEYIEQTIPHPKIVVLCGPGNNGGDGFVAARYLSKKYPVTVFLIATEEHIHTSIARMNFSKLKSLPISLHDQRHLDKLSSKLNEATVIVDAMLGVGIQGELRSPYDEIVKNINRLEDKKIICVDVPTGMQSSLSVHPQATITFHDVKPDMNKENCGEILVKDIHIPQKAQTHVGPGELTVYYPKPKKDSHKGENGRVLIIGGGPFTGAPALSALAALRTGADLVFVSSPKLSARTISYFSPNIIVSALESKKFLSQTDVPEIVSKFDQADSILIGPGLGSQENTAQAICSLVEQANKKSKKLILDADAIKPLFDHYDLLKDSETIITPHAKEFQDLTGEILPSSLSEKQELISSWAKRLGITLFVKGSIDVLSDGNITRLNTVHNPAMTVGGTGDVLAGMIAALLAKDSTPMNAVRIAAFLNGEAGNQAFKTKSYGLLATDIIESIPKVLKTYVE